MKIDLKELPTNKGEFYLSSQISCLNNTLKALVECANLFNPRFVVAIKFVELEGKFGTYIASFTQKPTIYININTPLSLIPTVVAHEMAHALIEPEVGLLNVNYNGHNDVFKSTFKRLRETFHLQYSSAIPIRENGWRSHMSVDMEALLLDEISYYASRCPKCGMADTDLRKTRRKNNDQNN